MDSPRKPFTWEEWKRLPERCREVLRHPEASEYREVLAEAKGWLESRRSEKKEVVRK
jgi:hypothetical protein